MPIRADKKATYDQLLTAAEALRASKDVNGGSEAFQQAAAVFAGSKDAEELELRHRAMSEAAGILRSNGRPAEACAAYEAMSAAALAEAGPGATPYLLSRYFLGLTRQDLNDEAGAVQPLTEAVAGYEKRPNADQEVGLIGTALGLSLMRQHRFADAADVLTRAKNRLVKLPAQVNSLAAALHNLAMSQVRGGDAKAGLATAAEAVALREKINGKAHPLTIETSFVLALAQIDAGELEKAGAVIRTGALGVLQGAGEAHGFFADALLLEARRQARLGDGTAAEALARRALFVIGQAGISSAGARQRQLDAAEIRKLWRTRPASKNVALWRVSMQHTLRRYRVATLDFEGSGDRPKEWFFFVPAEWPVSDVRYATQLVFGTTNAFLNAREPADANFLDATLAVATVPTEAELLAVPLDAAFRSFVWEPSIAFNLMSGASATPLTPADFAEALAAFLPGRGPKVDAWLSVLGGDVAAARNNSAATLRRVLGID